MRLSDGSHKTEKQTCDTPQVCFLLFRLLRSIPSE